MTKKIPQLADMFKQLIATSSVSCTQPHWDQSNLDVIHLLERWLKDLGFKTQVLPLPNDPKKANLVATLGSGPGGLVLAGHSDTVPYDQKLWHSDPFSLTETNDKWYGLGTSDMKGFFPIAMEAAKAFLDKKLKHPLIILATADEETSMAGARALTQQNAFSIAGVNQPRYAVIGEPTNMKPIRMHKGIMMERVQIKGQSGHSSDPTLGSNALDAMHNVLGKLIAYRQQLQQKHQSPYFDVNVPTLNLGCIHGGDNPNRICGHCELQFDLRALPGMNNAELRDEIAQLLTPVEQEFQVKLEVDSIFDGIPAFSTEEESDIVKTTEKLTSNKSESVAFATEAPFLQSMGIETLVLGPGDIAQAHQPNEYLDLNRIKPMVNVLQQLINRFCL